MNEKDGKGCVPDGERTRCEQVRLISALMHGKSIHGQILVLVTAPR